jgi:hypothetical protein
MRGVWPWLVGCAALSAPRIATAAPLIVDWQAPECAQEAAFQTRVRDALQREPESVLERELRVRVQIAEIATKSGYSLQIRMAAGSRELELPSCQEAVAAAATVVALAIDPSAVTADAGSTEREPAAAPPTTEPEARAAAPAPPPPPSLPRWQPYAIAFGGVSIGEVPAPSPLAGVGLGLRSGAFSADAEGFWVASQTKLLEGTSKGGRIGLWGAGVSACYSPLQQLVRLSGCLAAQAGAWHSRGEGVTAPTEQSDWWLAGVGRLMAGARLTPQLGLFLSADMVIPARRPHFKLAGVGEVFRPSPLTERISGGLELSF